MDTITELNIFSLCELSVHTHTGAITHYLLCELPSFPSISPVNVLWVSLHFKMQH